MAHATIQRDRNRSQTNNPDRAWVSLILSVPDRGWSPQKDRRCRGRTATIPRLTASA